MSDLHALKRFAENRTLCVCTMQKIVQNNGAEMLKPVCLNHVYKNSCFHKKSYCWYETTCYNTWL